MVWFFLLSVFPLLSSPAETVESVTYDVMYGKKAIGELVAEKRVSGDLVTYSTLSKTSFNVFGKHTVVHSVEATYKNGVLQSSKMSSVKDGKPKNNTKINLANGHYNIVENGDSKTHQGSVNFTSVMLYFVKPRPSIKVMSERDASFKTIESLSSNSFTLTSGKRSDSQDYTYSGNALDKVLVRNPMFSITIQRR